MFVLMMCKSYFGSYLWTASPRPCRRRRRRRWSRCQTRELPRRLFEASRDWVQCHRQQLAASCLVMLPTKLSFGRRVCRSECRCRRTDVYFSVCLIKKKNFKLRSKRFNKSKCSWRWWFVAVPFMQINNFSFDNFSKAFVSKQRANKNLLKWGKLKALEAEKGYAAWKWTVSTAFTIARLEAFRTFSTNPISSKFKWKAPTKSIRKIITMINLISSTLNRLPFFLHLIPKIPSRVFFHFHSYAFFFYPSLINQRARRKKKWENF